MPYDQIIEKIKEQKSISEDEIKTKVQDKLDQLSGLISKEGAAHIIANELGVKLFDKTSGKMKIDKILPGMKDLEIVGKITNVFEVREFAKGDNLGKVGSFIIGDETGTLRVVCWHGATDIFPELKEDKIVKIESTYSKENQGKLEVHCNENTKIVVDPEGETIGEVAKPSFPKSQRKAINQLNEDDQNVEVLGTVVQVFEPRFYEICPDCGKRAQLADGKFNCSQHGEVNPSFGFVMNAFLDDGTENMRVVFFRNQACSLLKLKQDEFLKFKDAPDSFDDVKTDLLGEIVKVVGRVQKNDMFDRLELVAQLVFPDPNPEQELKGNK